MLTLLISLIGRNQIKRHLLIDSYNKLEMNNNSQIDSKRTFKSKIEAITHLKIM